MRRTRQRDHLVALAHLHHGDALGRTRTQTDGFGGNADNNAFLRNNDHIVVEIDHLDGGNLAVFINMIVGQTLAASRLQAVILGTRQSAVARLADGEHQTVLAHHAHADDLVALPERERLDAARHSAHGSHVGFHKADRHTQTGRNDHIGVAVGHAHPCEVVVLIQLQSDQAALARRIVGVQLNAFDNTLSRDHDKVLALFKFRHADHRRDLFIRRDREQVGYIDALCLTCALGHLVAFQAVDPALIGEEQHIVVRVDDEHLGGDVLLAARHARNASAASALELVGIHRKALDVTELRQREHALLLRDQVLNVHLAADGADLCASRVGVFIANRKELLLDDLELFGVAGEYLVIFLDFCLQSGDLFFYFGAFHIGELSQTHLHDRVCLHLVQAKALHQRGSGGRQILAAPDDGDDLVDKVYRDLQALQNMGAVHGFFEIELRSAVNDLFLKVDVAAQHIL